MNQPDPLTIAYIAMGAHKAITAAQTGKSADEAGMIFKPWDSELEFIAEIIEHAARLDAHAEVIGRDGVFVYDIAEPFGEQMADAMLRTGSADAVALAAELFGEL